MADPSYDINEIKRRMQGAIATLKHELGGLRTGRASATMLDPVQVEAYGNYMPLNQVATVSVPEPRMLSVQVWDKSVVHAVEKAIMAANLGLTPSTEGQTLRLRVPELNEDRRKDLVKVAHKYAEAQRVAVRHVRRDGLDTLKKLEKDHKISEDDGKRSAEQVQKVTDETIAEIDKVLAVKEREIPHSVRSESPMGMFNLPATDPPGDFAVPRHVAIIMDGNGRWAAARGLPRTEGHRRGVEALRRTVRAAGDLGIGILTIFTFSSENWSRPPSEIRDLMGLLRRFIRKDLAELERNGVHVRVIGDRVNLDPNIRRLLEEAEDRTRNNNKLTLVVAFNYGARQEIARAAQQLAAEVLAGRLTPDAVTAEKLGSYLYAPEIRDPDLIIRTSGEQRLSNFLLWQAAYSELVFVPTYWPDFDRTTLESAIAEYRRRERRFGGLVAKTGS